MKSINDDFDRNFQNVIDWNACVACKADQLGRSKMTTDSKQQPNDKKKKNKLIHSQIYSKTTKFNQWSARLAFTTQNCPLSIVH